MDRRSGSRKICNPFSPRSGEKAGLRGLTGHGPSPQPSPLFAGRGGRRTRTFAGRPLSVFGLGWWQCGCNSIERIGGVFG